MKTVIKTTIGTLCLILLTACNTSITHGKIRDTGFVYCGQREPASFNPQLTDSGILPEALGPQLYDTLLTIDPATLQPVANIATKWTVDKTQTVYTFTLRHHVEFQTTPWFTPSRPLDARDVVFSFERIISPTNPFHNVNGGHYPWFDSINFQKRVKEIEAIGSDRVRFVLTHPDHNFLFDIATTHAVILSKEYANRLSFNDEKHLIDIQPVGTGPFMLDEYHPNDFIRLIRNPHYWNGVAKMQQVVFDVAQRGTGTLSKLLLDECDVLSTPISSQIPVIEQRSNIALTSTPAMNVSYIAINTHHPAISDSRVRRALSYAINRESILDSVYYGTGHIAHSLVPPASLAWSEGKPDNLIRFDANYAKGLLKDAGFDQGLELTMLVSQQPTAYDPSPRKTAELIQANFRHIGVKLKLISSNTHTLTTDKQADLVLTGESGRTADPDNFLRPILSCNAINHGLNISNWCNQDFDSLLDDAVKIHDSRYRSNIYKQAQHIINQEMPIIPIAHGMQFKAYNKSLTGLTFSPFNVQPFNHVERLQ